MHFAFFLCVCLPGGMCAVPQQLPACAWRTEEAPQSCRPQSSQQVATTPTWGCGAGCAVWIWQHQEAEEEEERRWEIQAGWWNWAAEVWKHLLRRVRERGGGRVGGREGGGGRVGFWGFSGVRNPLQLLWQNVMCDVIMPGKTCKHTRAHAHRQLKEATDAESERKCLLKSILFVSALSAAAALMNEFFKCVGWRQQHFKHCFGKTAASLND